MQPDDSVLLIDQPAHRRPQAHARMPRQARARACLARHPGVGLWSAMGWLVDEEDRIIRLHVSPVVALGDAYLPPQECVRLAYRVGNWFVGSTVVYHRDPLEA